MKKYIPFFALIVSLLTFVSPHLLADNPLEISLTEDQACNEEQTISVPLQSELEVKLHGSEFNSSFYSSGSGSQHGERWNFNGSKDDNALKMTAQPTGEIIHAPFDIIHSIPGYAKEDTSYCWKFTAEQPGISTLSFKKYRYSDSKIRNQDGSAPWEDPIQEIHFTIQVIDSKEIGAE
ncbi:MAG: hypothetical protein K9M81_03790 [Chthoniobacterales bacterium]|nr:hypothetical protein [Chthoniobacterales bacterium]